MDSSPRKQKSRQAGHSPLLIRSPLGFVARCALLQHVDEMTAGTRHACMLASHDVFCLNGMAIDLFAGLVIGTKRRALEGNSGKHPAGTRVTQDLGSHPSVSTCGSIASFRASGNGSIRA